MKQSLIPKPDIAIHKSFNQRQAKSLKILELNNDELLRYLKESSTSNHFLSLNPSSIQDGDTFLAYNHTNISLYDEIMEQVRYSKYNPDTALCEFLIFQLDSNGYFHEEFRELVKKSKYSKEMVKKHLAILRTFEPHGLFAFSLSESLKIQCKLSKSKYKVNAFILCDYLEDMAQGRIQKIMELTKLSELEIQESFKFIRTLNPKPAANYSTTSMYINPEFKIDIENHKIKIQLLQEDLQLEVRDETYKDENKEIQEFLKKQRQEARMIMDSVKKRNMTLLQIMQSICEIQSGFFLHDERLRHCTLQMISSDTNLHVSTISRAISNKSCEFNKRYYPLKNFFHSGGNDLYTKEEIQDKIINIIDNENKIKPYSDEKIRVLLAQENIVISRRAVSKYRESAYIYNSQKRKK